MRSLKQKRHGNKGQSPHEKLRGDLGYIILRSSNGYGNNNCGGQRRDFPPEIY